MASYIVLTPPDAEAGADDILVRDGFTWLAFLVPLLWFAWHRMWLWAAAFLLAGLAVSVVADRTDWGGTAIFALAMMALWAGFEAGAQRVAALADRGWIIRDVVVASGRDMAEAIWFDRPRPAPRLTKGRKGAIAAPAARRAGGPALGLLDYDGGN